MSTTQGVPSAGMSGSDGDAAAADPAARVETAAGVADPASPGSASPGPAQLPQTKPNTITHADENHRGRDIRSSSHGGKRGAESIPGRRVGGPERTRNRTR